MLPCRTGAATTGSALFASKPPRPAPPGAAALRCTMNHAPPATTAITITAARAKALRARADARATGFEGASRRGDDVSLCGASGRRDDVSFMSVPATKVALLGRGFYGQRSRRVVSNYYGRRPAATLFLLLILRDAVHQVSRLSRPHLAP